MLVSHSIVVDNTDNKKDIYFSGLYLSVKALVRVGGFIEMSRIKYIPLYLQSKASENL